MFQDSHSKTNSKILSEPGCKSVSTIYCLGEQRQSASDSELLISGL